MTDAIQMNSVLKRKGELVTSVLGDETVMLDSEAGMYHGLDAIGTEIWGMLENPVSVSDMCERLQASYDVDADTCQKDVLAFLNRLAAKGVVTIEQ